MQNEAAGGGEEKCHTSCVRFTGIRHRKWGKWGAEIRLCRSRSKIWLGSFDTPQEAALAYDAAVYCLRGPNSRFNFPESRSRISSSLSSFASAAFSCMSRDDIKNFCRNYALQHRISAEAELPTQQQQDQFSHDHQQVSSSAAAAVAASVHDDAVGNLPELCQLWDLDENVAWFQREMQLGILMQQPLHHYEQNTMIQGDEMKVESWAATVWSG